MPRLASLGWTSPNRVGMGRTCSHKYTRWQWQGGSMRNEEQQCGMAMPTESGDSMSRLGCSHLT